MKPIPYGRQYIDEEDIKAVVEVLKSDFLTQGPKVREFEQVFAQKTGSKYAIAVANGTAALHLANLAIGISKGDKVITTPISFVATSNSVLYCGGEIDFVDINAETFTIDLDIEFNVSEVPHVLAHTIYDGLERLEMYLHGYIAGVRDMERYDDLNEKFNKR